MHLLFVLSDTASPSLLTALGINWVTLLLDMLGFFVAMAILAKFVYPSLIKAIDAKQGELEAAATLELRAKQELTDVQVMVAKIISDAHEAADEVIDIAKTEAAELVQLSGTKAAEQADRIVSEAHEQIERDVRVARTALKTETARLIATATETLLGDKLNDATDSQLIAHSLRGDR